MNLKARLALVKSSKSGEIVLAPFLLSSWWYVPWGWTERKPLI